MFSQLQSIAIDQLKALSSDVRIIQIHPNYVQQRLILADLDEALTVYHCCDSTLQSGATFQASFTKTLREQLDSDKLPNQGIVILDQCDQVDPQLLTDWLQQVLKDTSEVRFVLFGRQIIEPIFHLPDLRDKVSVLPVDEGYMLWDYKNVNSEHTLLEVRSFGEGQAILNGQLITNWDGILPRSLFFFLVDRGMTTRAEIFHTFWPTLSTREATNVFHVTKRKISEVLGRDLTTYWSGFYRISPDIELSYDVRQFSELLQTSAIADPDSAHEQLMRAIGIYRDDFLSSMDLPWAMQRREELAMDYADALTEFGDLLASREEIDQALGYYLRALAINKQRTPLAKKIMKIYHNTHQHAAAIALYDYIVCRTQDSNLTVDQSLKDLAATIKQEAGHSVA
jgi:tetratricopeptide (TPR) repeat protein